MRSWKQAVLIILFAFSTNPLTVVSQQPFRVSDQQVTQLLARLDTHTENFRRSLATAINRSFLHDAPIGRYINLYTWELEQLTDRLKDRSRDRKPISSEVQEVLNRGPYLDTFMNSYDLGKQAKRDWQLISADLNELASYYKIETYWGKPTAIGSPPRPDLGSLSNRLIGTYELERAQSENVRDAVERSVKELPPESRRRVMSALVTRLRAPERLAIDRHGDKVTLASSLQTSRVYTATAHAYNKQASPDDVLLYGNEFRLNSIGTADDLYSVTYATIEGGARLHVTRTALLRQFPRPLVVVSYYKKISDVPQLNLGTEEPDSNASNQGDVPKKNLR